MALAAPERAAAERGGEVSMFPVVAPRVESGASGVSATNLSPEDYKAFMAGTSPPPPGDVPQNGASDAPVIPAPIPGDNTVRQDFMAGRSLAQAGNPWQSLDALITSTKSGAASSDAGVTGEPEVLGADNERPVGRRLVDAPRYIPSSGEAFAGAGEGEELSPDLNMVIRPTIASAKDIATGGVETPQAVLRGVIGGVENLGRTINTVGDAIDGALPYWLGMGFPGRTGIHQGIQTVADYAAEDKSQIPEPTSVTGGLIEQIAQFGTGLLGGKKAADAIGLTGRGAQAFADVFAGATSMDPAAPRLSNLLNEVAPNFVTEWLKAKPGDETTLMGRLKSGLEFAGLGVIFEGVKAGLGAIKSAIRSTPQPFGPVSAIGRGPPGTVETSTVQRPAAATGTPPEGVLPFDWNGASQRPLVEITPRLQGMAETVLEQQQGMERPFPSHAGAPIQEPPVPEGMTRLYRAEPAPSGRPVSEWVAQGKAELGHSEAEGRWFTADRDNLAWYQNDLSDEGRPANTFYIDVPTPEIDKYRVSNSAEEIAGRTPQSFSRDPENEFFLPRDMADQKQPLAASAPGHRLSAAELADYVAGRTADNPIRINLLRVGSGEDIQNILEEVARTIPEPDVVSNESTIRAADASGLSVSDFLAGYAGKNLDARETTAMRFVLDSSAAQVIEYAKTAANPLTNSEEAKATFIRAFATHRALQQYYVNARAEAGRTLQSWSIMSREMTGQGQALQKLIEQAGDQNVTQMASDIASLDDPLQVSRLIAAADRGTGRDSFNKVFYNVLLSNPRTVVKKLASDGAMVMWNLATNYTAEKFGSGAIPPGETAALGWGYLSSLKDAVRMAGKGLAAGQSEFFQQFQTMDWLDHSRLSAMANGAPEIIPESAPTQAGASYLRAALPTSWIGAADDFAKYLNYRAYLNSLAFRDGVEQGLDGADLATHITATLDNVPNSLHQEALTNTLRSTFQEPLTGIAKIVQDAVNSEEPSVLNLPVFHTDYTIPVGKILLPFVKVPTNIARWSYRNSVLAPMMPTRGFQSELSAGGATRDLAMARVWLGSAVALSVADMALNNTLTGAGPHDPQLHRAWLAAGNQPYSVQLPGQRPVSYNMVEPLGMMMGGIADSFNIMKFARDDGRENIAASLMFGVGHAMLSKTYMQGVSNIFEAMNDPERQGDFVAQSLAMTFLSPQGVAAAAHALDPWIRYHRTLLENEESRLPIVSERLPPARTLWGDAIPQKDAYLPFMPSGSFVAKMLSPWHLGQRPEDVEPIDRWIWDNRSAFPRAESNRLGISKPSEFQSFPAAQGISVQVHLEPREYDRFLQLSGNNTKNPESGLGAKDLLNGLVRGESIDRGAQDAWNVASPAMRALMVQRVVNGYRKAAQVQLLREFPEIRDAVETGVTARARQLRGGSVTPENAPH